MNNNLIENINAELKEIENLKEDYKKKIKMFGEDSYNEGAIHAFESAENHIKRAIAKAMFPEHVQELQKWIGCLCEAYKCNNHITWNAIAEQVVYEMFKNELSPQEQEGKA